MPTLERAQKVKAGMEKGTGAHYRIWRDTLYHCYRVLPWGTERPFLKPVE